MHLQEDAGLYSGCYSLCFSELSKTVHKDDFDYLSEAISQMLSGQVSEMTVEFRKESISGEFYLMSWQCEADDQMSGIMVEQSAYLPELRPDQHVYHKEWIETPYHFFHYRKLVDDLNEVVSQKRNVTLFYFNISKVRTLVNQYGYDILDRIYNCIFDAFDGLAYHSISRYQSILGNFVVLIDHPLSDEVIKATCERIISGSENCSKTDSVMGLCELGLGVIKLPSQISTPRELLHAVARTSEYALRKSKQRWEMVDCDENSKISRHFYIEKELRSAIANDRLTVKFQPILDRETAQPQSFEILSRWEESDFGEIYPDEFIPVAESQNLINELGWAVLRKACRFLCRMSDAGFSDVKVNVNVSVLQLQDSEFYLKALGIVTEFGVSPDRVVIEITESVLLDNSSLACTQLLSVSQLGFTISLDDFGSGYSTLNSLFSLPIQQIKLDKGTASKAMQHQEAMNYICFLLDMCNRNDVQFLVEGIETEGMFNTYVEKQVHCLQGFYIAKPMYEDAVLEYLNSSK
ncbi:EAL domain-containing protein [Vibrio sp. SCSIO 43137]|uniref:EAL domain-containing protein n=1 Tax=Vibrio sp. SCSIO 43137 TaxID=3021011 RepID=UPI0023074CA0|nr:EAL domain-containing protein [Vibrio sp. SCSIO 43137]WCE32527.1 EAL domain-containing protein [Vibrio sp. SCSIO 43137]